MSQNSESAAAPAPGTAPTRQTAHSQTTWEATLTLPANLHARPAGKLAQTAARFSSAIQLDYAGRTINPTGVLAVMSLGATIGATLTLRAQGEDAEQAVRTLTEILTTIE